jgi:hypothetical protein
MRNLIDRNNDSLCQETLQHELHHAYQNWQKTKNKGVQLKNDLIERDKKYGSYDKFEYYFDKEEFEGHLNNIIRTVKQLISKNKKLKIIDIFDYLSSNDNSYQFYKYWYENALYDSDNWNKSIIKKVIKYWKKLNNHIYNYYIENNKDK